jgi:predicted TIM-barrel fold metal-dependent hydrolase
VRTLDDLANDPNFTTAKRGEERTVTLLPDPPRAERSLLVISADDHVVEPPDTFEGRLPSRFGDRAPHVVEKDDGSQVWLYDGQELPNVGFNALVGRPVEEYGSEPVRFDQMRKGAWDIHERVRDMDLNGVYASLNFPSFLPGFAGQRLQLLTDDVELAEASVRAWNDWHHDAWWQPYPDRIIPCQIPWLLDPEKGAAMIRENAERGFTSVTFPESPTPHGLPSLHTDHWDPFMEACAETGTVINLHVGSSGSSPNTTDDAPPDVTGVLFFAYAMFAAVDWLYSGYPTRHPDLKICLSEGGIGWVAGLVDRLEHMETYNSMYGTWTDDLRPSEVFLRNFWFCAIEDPSSFRQRDVIGVENIMIEQDYPHIDSTWPRTQALTVEAMAGLPDDDVQRLCWRNAAELYRHPVPQAVQDDPNAY